jgi:hypothetical protein
MNSEEELFESSETDAVPDEAIAREVRELKAEYRNRLITANLRTEAVRAGMIDLDGLKLLDTSKVELNSDDSIIEGPQLMRNLRKNKPWLFKSTSSSSLATAPNSRPIRQKTAMEMTDEEYAAARKAIVKH